MHRLVLTILAVACCVGHAQADVLFRCPAQLAALQQEILGLLATLNFPIAQVSKLWIHGLANSRSR